MDFLGVLIPHGKNELMYNNQQLLWQLIASYITRCSGCIGMKVYVHTCMAFLDLKVTQSLSAYTDINIIHVAIHMHYVIFDECVIIKAFSLCSYNQLVLSFAIATLYHFIGYRIKQKLQKIHLKKRKQKLQKIHLQDGKSKCTMPNFQFTCNHFSQIWLYPCNAINLVAMVLYTDMGQELSPNA